MTTAGLPSRDVATPPRRHSGQVAYLFAFDIAYDMRREPITRLLGQPVEQFAPDADKRSPREGFFYCPQMVNLPPLERVYGPEVGRAEGRPLRVERWVKLFPAGAVSIGFLVPFEDATLEELVAYHDLRFADRSLADEARTLAQKVRDELGARLIRPVAQLKDEEAYTVFCLHPLSPAPVPATMRTTQAWLERHRREVAALLTQEPDPQTLSDQEAVESTGRYLSYYEDDLVVTDWDAALIIDEPDDVDEILHVMELSNVQLAELEAYDRLLDEAIERSYLDLGSAGRGVGRRGARVLRGLRELRIDLARLSDELSNITKFFGDWHFARVYREVSARFHLLDWEKTVDEKLQMLDSVYSIAKQDQTNRWMMVLEVTIVLLFIIDLVILVLLSK